jgi:glucosamine-6-phosphate deaminase
VGALQPDLCCLGIGENGHLAFNDPPVANFEDPLTVKLVQLDEPCRQQQVGEGYFPDIAAVPRYAFTLTIPALCSAKKMICVVPEKRKAGAVKKTLRGPISPACPASFLRRQGHCTLFLDADSASLL